MPIELDLAHHCIETEIRRRYNAAIARYFKAQADKGVLEAQIDLLHRALQAFDFRRLRARWPDLGGHTPCRPQLICGEDGGPVLCMGKIHILPPAEPI